MTSKRRDLEDYKAAVADERSSPRRWQSAGTGPGVIVVSVDAHVGPPIEDFRSYCPKKYLDDFDRFAAASATHPSRDEQSEPQAPVDSSSDGSDRQTEPAGRATYRNVESIMPHVAVLQSDPLINYDPHHRLQRMDEDGIAAEVTFHGVQSGAQVPFLGGAALEAFNGSVGEPVGGGSYEAELAATGVRIYNRWLADYCSTAPERLLGIAFLPLWDVDLAVQEVEFARSLGLRGANFPAPRPTLPSYSDLCWEPLWTACEATAMPLNTHAGSTATMKNLGSYSGTNGLAVFAMEMAYLSRRAVPFMVLGGVFERHPALKMVLTEQSTAWVPDVLRELDSFGASTVVMADPLPKDASEYFRSNVFLGASFLSNHEASTALADGSVANVMWGRDYPHGEGTWPYTKYSVRKTMTGIPEDAVRQILGLTALEVFGLSLPTMQGIADTIGPAIDEVMTPLAPDEIPSGAEFTSGFRELEFAS